jgi:O-antigen/teichoic acid export membrane protein
MITGAREKITNYFNKGHHRTALTKKNIAASFAIKAITILCSLIMIPLTIDYVNPERNGIWLTLYSVIFWFNLFDLGLGTGMRNKLAEAKSLGDNELARKYISSTYTIVGFISLGIFVVFCLVNPFIDWLAFLENIPVSYAGELSGLVWISVLSFCLIFCLNLLKMVVTADQRPAIAAFLDMFAQILTLCGIFILSKTMPPSLITLGMVTGFAPVVVYLVANIYLFNTRYKDWRPSFRHVQFSLARNMMNLGIKFFISGCAAFMITQTLPFLILRLTNSEEVTNYNTAFRLFSLVFNVIGIIIIPYWSSFTDAYTQKDFDWMKKSMKVLYKFLGILLVLQIILLALSDQIYYFWVNHWMTNSANALSISPTMSVAVCVYVCTMCWLNINIYPINGIGKLKLQVYGSVLEMILLIPVALWAGTKWGAPGVIFASVLVQTPRMIWAPIQLNKLIKNKARGIWNK